MAVERSFGSASMVAPLRRVLVCGPEACGWSEAPSRARWEELGYRQEPDAAGAGSEWRALCDALAAAGAEVLHLERSAGLTLDAVYAHDASLVSAAGALCLRMGKAAREAEPAAHAAWYERGGIPVLGVLEAPATAEAGDLVWLDPETLLAGHGYRTNAEGIAQLRALLGPHGVQVLEAPLPHGPGPGACLHLMSLMSLLDERTVLVDEPWLSVPTLRLLEGRGYRRVPIEGAERDTLACNVLALGEGRLLALAENPATNRRLGTHGFDVVTVSGGELCINGGGGPTCLTRPILRAPG